MLLRRRSDDDGRAKGCNHSKGLNSLGPSVIRGLNLEDLRLGGLGHKGLNLQGLHNRGPSGVNSESIMK